MTNNQLMDDAIIKEFSLDDNMILAVDKDARDLLHFKIKVGNIDLLLKAPSYIEHMKLMVEHAKLVQMLAKLKPSMVYASLAMFLNDDHRNIYLSLYNELFKHKKIIKKIEKILFRFFAIPVSKREFRKNASLFDLQKIFCFLCIIDECIKKNAEFLQSKIYPQTMFQSSPTAGNSGELKQKTFIRPAS